MRIAIIGGGISGLTAAYELEKARKAGHPLDWHLYEAGNRLGGIVETLRHDGFILEGGPDGWVTEKTAARDLAIELGLESELIPSNDATRKTYILLNGELIAIPDGMRMMVPEDLAALENSTLFSLSARQSYAAEPTRAAELKASAPQQDESVASFVQRHFGEEVLTKIAAPLLGGVFGGDVHKLSVQAVMPQFVAMEREHGSLILALQSKSRKEKRSAIFTSLRGGMQTLIDALVATLPSERIHLNHRIESVPEDVEKVIVATSLDTLRKLLPGVAPLVPQNASSAVLAAFGWKNTSLQVPQGFGFLVPDGELLAATFVDQKFPDRVPPGGKIIRAFFGGKGAAGLMDASDEEISKQAKVQLEKILGPLPEPDVVHVTRWPRSLPQYEVDHLERLQKLQPIMQQTQHLHLLGNMFGGVGLPDLVRQAQGTIAKIVDEMAG